MEDEEEVTGRSLRVRRHRRERLRALYGAVGDTVARTTATMRPLRVRGSASL